MSAKGRGPSLGGPYELNQTPAWTTRAFFTHVGAKLPHSAGSVWWEPCAGGGAMSDVIRDMYPDVELLETDISPLRPEIKQADARYFKPSEKIDVIVTNPPFSLALPIIQSCLNQAPYVVMLLRLNWLASAVRSDFFRRNMPDVYVLAVRPSFDLASVQNANLIDGRSTVNGVEGYSLYTAAGVTDDGRAVLVTWRFDNSDTDGVIEPEDYDWDANVVSIVIDDN